MIPLQASSGVLSFTASVGLRFKTCTAQFTASGQKVLGIFFSDSMLRTKFMMVRFFRSATPFCCGEYAAVNCLCTPCSLQKLLNSQDVNSPSRSVRNIFRDISVAFSTCILKLLKMVKASDFSAKKYTHVF